MEQDLQRLAVRRQDDELRLATVESFGGFVSSLPQLLIVAGLLHQVQDLSRQSLTAEEIMSLDCSLEVYSSVQICITK